MMKKMILPVTAFVFAASVSSAFAGSKSQERAERMLAGFEKTDTVKNCVPLRQVKSMKSVGDKGFLVKVGRDYYLNDASNGCSLAGRAGYAISYETSIGSLCRGEIIRIIDTSQGFTGGSCSLGKFTKLERKESSEAE